MYVMGVHLHEYTCIRTVQSLCEPLASTASEMRAQVWQDCAQPLHHLYFKQTQGITAPVWWIVLLQVPWKLQV